MRSRTKVWMGVIVALNVMAGLLWAQGTDPSKGASPQPPDKALYPIPVPMASVTGRVLTEVKGTPVAGAYVRLEPVSPGPIVIYGETAQGGTPPPNVRSDQAGQAGQPQPTTPDKKPETQGPVVGGPVYPTIYPGLGAVTDAEGNFKIAAYPGKFVVRVEAQGFEPEYFDNVKDRKGAREIELQYGMSPVELAIKLKSISTLAGKVTEAGTGNAIPLGTVVAVAERIGLKRSASLGPDGTYLIEGLMEGRYTVQARARGYLPATYTSGTGSDNNIVTVRQNTAVTGIDFALSKGLSFSGKVTVEGGDGLAGVIVVASRINAKEGLEQTAESGADGSYTMSGLLAGDYIVYARKPGYGLQVYPNAKDRSQAKPVTVAADKQPTDIHFALSRVGTILGTVTARADGKPVAGAIVTAYGVAGFGSRQARTDAQGRYIIPDLPTADFLVTASAKGFVTLFYENTPDKAKAKQVRVLSDAHTAGIDFAMAPMAAISGTVTGDGPIEGAQVMLSLRVQIKPPEPRPLPPEPGRPVPMPLPYPQPGYLMIVKTGANGAFRFENVEAGAYIVHASAKGFIGEYYDDVRSPDAAKPIEVAASQNITGINLSLTALASISGKVAAADGKPLKGIEVVAFVQRPMRDGIVPPPGGGPQPLPAGQAGGPTTKEGAVASSGQGGTQPRQPGSQPPQPPTKDAPGSPPPSGQVQPQPTPSKDGAVPPPFGQAGPQPQPTQRQTGAVADQKGGVVIQPGPVAPEGVPIPPDGYVTRFRAEVDAQTGTYKIVGLPEGNYVVRASADGYIPEFNGDAESAEKATPISVKDGDKIANVDFVLAKGGAISGFVLGDGDGRPVRGGQVTAQLLGDGGSSSRVEANGAFRVDGLRDGRYLLRAEGPGYVAEFYDDTRQPDKAKLIEIKGGSEVSDLIIGLAHRSPVDFNGDGIVDFEDFFVFTIGFGQRKGMPNYSLGMDLNSDGGIDFEDFFAFVSEFSKGMKKAGKPVAGADAGKASFTTTSATDRQSDAPSGLVAIRMTLDVADLAGYAAALSYDREGLTFMRAERQDGGVPTVSSSPDGILLTDRASGPVTVTLTFRPAGDVRGGDLVTPKMIALIGADGGLRLLDVAAAMQADATPKTFSLAQNVPNPFNPATQIAFETPADGPVNLTVYNLLGQRVRVLVDERRVAGRYVATWDGRDELGRPTATGLYLYRLTAPGFTQTRKMMLLR